MKIYSRNRSATVTLTTSQGIVATVGHFYRGDPVTLDNGYFVSTAVVSTTYDYYLGVTDFRHPTKVAIVDLIGKTVEIHTDRGVYTARVERKIDDVTYILDKHIAVDGDSGSPVMIDGIVVGYITHTNAIKSIKPVLRGILSLAKKLTPSTS